MKKIVMTILSVALLCATLGFSACNKADGDVKVLLDWTPNTNHTGLYVAQALGYYEEEGLKVSIEQPGDTGTSLLVSSGQAQFGIDFQDQMAYNYSKKINVTAVAAIIQHNTSGIVSLASEGIDAPKKMENKVYATWDLEIEKAIIRKVMENDGGDYSKLQMVPNVIYDIKSALETTDVDCAWIFEAWDKIVLERSNTEINYFAFRDYADELDYYTPVIIANNDYLRNNPKQAQAFIRATEKGYMYAVEHPEEAAEILCKAVPELDADLVKASLDYLSGQYVADAEYWGVIDKTRWDSFFRWIKEEGIVKEDIPSGYGFTNEYLSGKKA